MASGPGGRLPDFFLIGAMKSGTTSLFRHLGRFFDADDQWIGTYYAYVKKL